MPRSNRSNGFTLVEVLVVIAIIGVLVAILLPAVQTARESARRTECQNNLKQIGLAIQMHHDVRRQFPSGRNGLNQFAVSWAFMILPDMEEKSIFSAHKPAARVDDSANEHAMRTPIATYACPSRRKAAADRNFDNDNAAPTVLAAATLGDYAANAGRFHDMGMRGGDSGSVADFGLFDRQQAGPIFTGSRIGARQVTDGLSKTFAIGERHLPPVTDGVSEEMQHYDQGDTAFLAGDNPLTSFRGSEAGLADGSEDADRTKFGSSHTSNLVQFTFLDGHVDAITPDIAVAVLISLSTIAGEESIVN